MKKNFLIYLTLLLVLWVAQSGFLPTKKPSMVDETDESRISYYGGYIGRKWDPSTFPLELAKPLTKKEALSRGEPYYVGFYDRKGMLYRIEKFDKGEMKWVREYYFYPDGKLKKAKEYAAYGDSIAIYVFPQNEEPPNDE